MTERKPHASRSRDVALKSDGNPDGKGANGFMLDWYRSEPRGLSAKPQRQVLAELFTSMLVLSAQFKYKPSAGAANYLYFMDGEWSLSLIAPDEWSAERQASFAGTCFLQHDMTWTITPSMLLGDDNVVSNAIARFYDAFAETLDTDLTLEEILPFYVAHMPYYQRLYANALSRSVRGAVILGDQASRPCRDWQRRLPGLDRLLVSYTE
ncbi:MAG: DUF2452 domain-containing protein [Woeseiaceae bacterium]